jgi:poly(3-hydroxybutyrate) depolymerase
MHRAVSMVLLSLTISALPLFATPSPTPALPRGQLVEKVVCKDAPGQAYALYLPSGYTPDRPWPILYAFDDREHGRDVAQLFQRAAESYGWIVVSSWNTASDGPIEPNIAAIHALWADTHSRFRIDERRVYAAGLSGTVRFSNLLALTAPGTIAGVIGASAGFPVGINPKKDDPFVFFGTYGDRDFNYYEMLDLEEKMSSVGFVHRIEPFAGAHQWPPEELARHAVGWMEMQAMKRGRRAHSPQIVEALWAADRARARAADAAGHRFDARHTWAAMITDYAGLHDTAEAVAEVAALDASEAYQKEVHERDVRDRRDRTLLAHAPEVFARAEPGKDPVTVGQLASELKIAELLERAASSDLEERLAASRVLNTYLVQTTFYLPRDYVEKKQYDRALFMLQLGAEMTPRDPALWVQVAAVHAQQGKDGRKKALEALRKAADLGLATPASLDDPVFASLRSDGAYRQITAQVATQSAAGDTRVSP